MLSRTKKGKENRSVLDVVDIRLGHPDSPPAQQHINTRRQPGLAVHISSNQQDPNSPHIRKQNQTLRRPQPQLLLCGGAAQSCAAPK